MRACTHSRIVKHSFTHMQAYSYICMLCTQICTVLRRWHTKVPCKCPRECCTQEAEHFASSEYSGYLMSLHCKMESIWQRRSCSSLINPTLSRIRPKIAPRRLSELRLHAFPTLLKRIIRNTDSNFGRSWRIMPKYADCVAIPSSTSLPQK